VDRFIAALTAQSWSPALGWNAARIADRPLDVPAQNLKPAFPEVLKPVLNPFDPMIGHLFDLDFGKKKRSSELGQHQLFHIRAPHTDTRD
jgi:hypothetical protein